jgi:hypothetical protein
MTIPMQIHFMWIKSDLLPSHDHELCWTTDNASQNWAQGHSSHRLHCVLSLVAVHLFVVHKYIAWSSPCHPSVEVHLDRVVVHYKHSKSYSNMFIIPAMTFSGMQLNW